MLGRKAAVAGWRALHATFHTGEQRTLFRYEWNRIGPELASRRVRDSLRYLRYLLYRPEHTPIEDRLTHDPG